MSAKEQGHCQEARRERQGTDSPEDLAGKPCRCCGNHMASTGPPDAALQSVPQGLTDYRGQA